MPMSFSKNKEHKLSNASPLFSPTPGAVPGPTATVTATGSIAGPAATSQNQSQGLALNSNPYLQFKLLNPFLNAFFSCNDPLKSSIKDIYLSLLQDRFSYAFIVPDSHLLLNNYDSTSGIPYRDLCFKTDFLKSHIVDLRNSNNHITRNTNISTILNTKKAKAFLTASNQELLFKRDQIFVDTRNGQSNSGDNMLCVKVHKIELFVNFNLFFPKNSEFLLIHVNRPLTGTPISEIEYHQLHLSPYLSQPLSNAVSAGHNRASSLTKSPSVIKNTVAKVIPGVDQEKAALTVSGSNVSTITDKHVKNNIINETLGIIPDLNLDQELNTPKVTYHELTGRFPLIDHRIGEDFQHLFKNFVIESINDPHEIATLFRETINQSALIFKGLDDTIIDAVFNYAPDIDMNRCIYDYVEFNLYDKLWAQLRRVLSENNSKYNNEKESIDKQVFLGQDIYDQLQDLSITQVGLFDDSFSTKRFKLQYQLNYFLLKVESAVKVFQNLGIANSYAEKSKILLQTIQNLTKIVISDDENKQGSGFIQNLDVNADMLVALMILVVIKSQVPDLHVHLEYIKDFSYKDPDVGLLGYCISTLDAVLYHLQNRENLNNLTTSSLQNRKLYRLVQAKDVTELAKFIDLTMKNNNSQNTNDGFLPLDHCLKSVNYNGDSVLMLAIKNSNYEIFKTLIDLESAFPIEDVIYDFNIHNITLLCAALNFEKNSIVEELVSIISATCTISESIEYYNFKDLYHRNLGHYLFHYHLFTSLIDKIGLFINWTDKDINSHTPLMSLCRNYDIANYESLVGKSFEIVDQWYKLQGRVFNYEDHIDNKGNTLLHILKNRLSLVLDHQLVNVNKFNLKRYTPLAMYIKYNRLQNIKDILKDKRLNINKTDTKTFLTILDFVKVSSNANNASASSSTTNGVKLKTIENGSRKLVEHSKSDEAIINQEIEREVDGYYLKKFFPLANNKKFGILRAKLDQNQWFFVIKGFIVNEVNNEEPLKGMKEHLLQTVANNKAESSHNSGKGNKRARQSKKIHNYVNYRSLNDFRELIRLLHIEHPVSYLPVLYLMNNFNKLNITAFAFFNFNKLKINHLTLRLNIFLVGLLLSKDFNAHELLWEFLILPAINTSTLETRSRLKMESYKEKLTIINESPIFSSPNIPEEFTDLGMENLEELFLIDHVKNYSIEEVQDIFNFLKYSLEELESFQKVFKKLLQLLIVSKLKNDDLCGAYNVLLKLMQESSILSASNSGVTPTFQPCYSTMFSELSKVLSQAVAEGDKIDAYYRLIFYLQFLESCADRLVKNIDSVINKKVLKWLKLASELSTTKAELMKLRPNDFKRYRQQQRKGRTGGAGPNTSRQNSIQEEDEEEDENDDSPLDASVEEQEARPDGLHPVHSRDLSNAFSTAVSDEDMNTLSLSTPSSPFNTNFDLLHSRKHNRADHISLSDDGSPKDDNASTTSIAGSNSSLAMPNITVNSNDNNDDSSAGSGSVTNSPNVKKKRSFLTNLIESRRTNYELKIIKQYKMNRLKLISLGNDVKFNHESLATEVNNFIEFKGLFMKYAIKAFVEEKIQSMKYTKMIFEKGLSQVTIGGNND